MKLEKILKLFKPIKNLDTCKNNSEKSLISKLGKHVSCGYSISTIWTFDHVENKHSFYHGEDCMNMFCSSLRDHAKNVIFFEKKRMLSCQIL